MEVHARAPGKIILAGEHAVVHGSIAVAAAIDLYTSSSLRLLPTGIHLPRPRPRTNCPDSSFAVPILPLVLGRRRCRRRCGGAGPEGLGPHLFVAVLAPPRGIGGGLLQGGGAETMLPGRAGRHGQTSGGARDPRGQDLALCWPLSFPLPLHLNLGVRFLFPKQCCENADTSQ
jgi:hypothetical protein